MTPVPLNDQMFALVVSRAGVSVHAAPLDVIAPDLGLLMLALLRLIKVGSADLLELIDRIDVLSVDLQRCDCADCKASAAQQSAHREQLSARLAAMHARRTH